MGNILGIFVKEDKISKIKNEKNISQEEINFLINERNKARKSKDFELADSIRNKLLEKGIEINDQSNSS